MRRQIITTLFFVGIGSTGFSADYQDQENGWDVQSVLCDLDCHRRDIGVELVQGYGSNVSEALVAAKQLCRDIGGFPLTKTFCRPVPTDY